MNNKLYEIADISSGLVVSRKKYQTGDEIKIDYTQLNLRTFNKNGYLDLNEAETLIANEKLSDDYLTQPGDIVVRLTDPFTAIYITEECKGIVVSSNFCIIRNAKINSEFLCYYLNSDVVKKQLLSNLQGTVIKNINMNALKQIDIPVFDKIKQEKYAKLFRAEIEKIKVLNDLITQEEKRMKIIMNGLGEE